MRKKIQQGTKLKNKLRTKIVIVFALISCMIAITGGVLVILNLQNLSKIRASATGAQGGGSLLNNGEIISEFSWENNPVTLATLGPDAMNVGKDAHSMAGGRSSTAGLSPGGKGRNIDLEIEANDLFRLDGIDVSIDYRLSEPTGDFFTRGNAFNFGIENGYLVIAYNTENKLGRTESVRAKTQYEIPGDPVFRNYRFIYTPKTGKAEIFVNNLIVWQHESEVNSALSWKNSGNIVIGRNMNGDGADRAIFDNLVVRNAGSVEPLAESLINFILEQKDGGVKVHWSTTLNNKVDYFTIERSVNGVDFTGIANVRAHQDSTGIEEEYTYTDLTQTTTPLAYYRIRQTFTNGKYISHSLSAIRFKTDKGFSIERINPAMFSDKCDISYYLPKPGRVWMQIIDEKENIVSTESFEATQGKNVHIFRNEKLQPGAYIFSLIFDNKKVSSKVVKI